MFIIRNETKGDKFAVRELHTAAQNQSCRTAYRLRRYCIIV